MQTLSDERREGRGFEIQASPIHGSWVGVDYCSRSRDMLNEAFWGIGQGKEQSIELTWVFVLREVSQVEEDGDYSIGQLTMRRIRFLSHFLSGGIVATLSGSENVLVGFKAV